ncbi:Zinc finger protein 208 [Mizuhopecten yessoensis]|uniref:Zinc finger protein 208 n=1 Tax=Mizuhopecten yessoensis TaxID=6573 RepID=A0A210PI01_MIZYE|nr:Zinc finger protein 208 [Mizuhopecten yessoensis]
MDNHQYPEGHAGEDPITHTMDQCTRSDIDQQESTKSCTQDISKTITNPKKEKIPRLSPTSAECPPLNTSSLVGASTSVSSTEHFSDSHLVGNIIPNHHSHPFVKLEPLDLESWGKASSDGKRTSNDPSWDQEQSATCERTEFGLLDMELRECDQKKVLLKMDMEEENLDDNGQRCENEVEKDKAESKCDECATLTSLDRENNTNCGKCGRSFAIKTNKQTQERYKCDQCGKTFSQFHEMQKHLDIHTQHLQDSQVGKFSCELCNKDYKSRAGLRVHMEVHQKSNKCRICGRCYYRKSYLLLHMKIHSRPASVGHCKLCDKTFRTKLVLKKHINSIHSVHPCETCGTKFMGKRVLDFHKLAHEHENQSRKFFCDICGDIYKSEDSFRTHLEIHKDESKPYVCGICGKSSNTVKGLANHLLTVNYHTGKYGDSNFNCDVCGKSCKDAEYLERHMKHHTNKLLKCEICNRGFTKQISLERHYESHNVVTIEHNCEKCDRTFQSEFALEKHVDYVHTTQSCDVCGKEFIKQKLKRHKAEHEKKFQCEVCGKYYSGVEGIKLHMQFHSRNALAIKKFACEVCGKKYLSQEGLKNHKRVHDKSIKCSVCSRCFSFRSDLWKHMKIHNRSESAGKCELCEKTFKTELVLKKHINSIHSVHPCETCGTKFMGKRVLDFHKLAHEHENQSRKFFCDICGDIYKSEDSFRTHLEIHKDESKPYVCGICGKSSNTVKGLANHLLTVNYHTGKYGDSNFNCDVCGKSCKDAEYLERHMKHHTNKLLKCEICNRGFTKQISLERHYESHNVVTIDHNCEKCDRTFQSEFALEKHVDYVHTTQSCDVCGKEFIKQKLKRHKAEHEKKFQCEVCGKYYSGVEGIKLHMQFHSRNALAIKKFACEVCGKKYLSQEGLKNHKRVHDKSIKCSVCSRCFSFRSDLWKHMKIHNRSESAGKCELCEKTFKTEYSLQKHTTKFHVMHSCDICGQNFQGKVLLEYHKLAHEHENRSHDFCCVTCGEKYKTFDSFHTHLEIHKNQDSPYRCDICGRTYREFISLRSHMKLQNVHADKDIQEGLKFSCDVCGKSFKENQMLEKHVKFHVMKKRQFSCSICTRSFARQSTLDKHYKKHSTETKGHQCEKCDAVFLTDFNLKKHLDFVHTTETCNICGEEVSKGKLKYHRAKHEEKQECDVCGKHYFGVEGIRRHMQYHARLLSGIKKFSCEVCGKQYHLQLGLKEHMRFHLKSIKCKICGRCFSHQSSLKKHMIIHTRPASIGKCETCGRTFQTEGVLQRHIKSFHVTKSCEICGLKFKEKPQKHIDRHHTSYVCDICGIKIDGNVLLECHKLAHVYEKGSFDFQCYECEKSYKTSDKLRKHVDIHTKNEEGSGRFGCEICGKRFASLYNLSSHVNNHRKEIGHYCKICGKSFKEADEEHNCLSEKITKYICEVCGRSFRDEFGLNRHKKVHGSVDFKCEQCNWLFLTEKKLQTHIDRVHKLAPCDICGQELTYQELPLHKRKMHTQDYICDICGHKCSGLSKLKTHLETHSTKEAKSFCCDICCKTLNTAAGLRIHKAIHTGAQKNKKTLICDICGKGFAERKTLFNHKLTHKPKSLQCNKCCKMFATRNSLLNHVKCRRECQTCGKIFVDTRLFKQHVELHDGAEEVDGNVSFNQSPCSERSSPRTGRSTGRSDKMHRQRGPGKKITDYPYKCRMCRRSFQSKINMENHTTRHHNKLNVKQFKCEMCFKIFTSKRALKAHDRVVHAKQSFDVSGTKCTATDLKKHTSTHKEQEKGQVSSRESVESIDNENSIDDKEVKRPKGQRGHMRESMVPFLTPRVISEDSMLLSKRETMDLPPEKNQAVNDDKKFLSVCILDISSP